MVLFTPSSSGLLGRPRCGLSIWLSLLAIFNALFWVYGFLNFLDFLHWFWFADFQTYKRHMINDSLLLSMFLCLFRIGDQDKSYFDIVYCFHLQCYYLLYFSNCVQISLFPSLGRSAPSAKWREKCARFGVYWHRALTPRFLRKRKAWTSFNIQIWLRKKRGKWIISW